MSETTHLALPLIAAAQAQKHVPHNEALAALDALVHLAVKDMVRTTPPGSPAEGDRHIIAAGATGAWAGKDLAVAAFVGGGWTYVTPRRGFVALDEADNRLVIFNGTVWVDLSASLVLQNLPKLGVNATADETNRLSVRSGNALFAAIETASGGSGDVRLTLNKEGAAHTNSLIFQSGWSGRAEFGLAGDDQARLKVSANGSTWRDAWVVDPATAAIRLPGGALEANDTGIPAPTPITGAKLHLVGSSAPASILIDTFSGVPQFIGRRAAGTASSPAALGGNTTLYQVGGYGRGATGYSNGARVSINMVSAEAWSDTAQGTRLSFLTTQSGTTTTTTKLGVSDVGDITPGADNAQNLGSASARFKEIFCANGTINTSDAHEKLWRGPLNDAEKRVALRLARLLGAYRWQASVDTKGEAARIHFGVTAQAVADAFRQEQLDPAHYALWCEDPINRMALRSRKIPGPDGSSEVEETYEVEEPTGTTRQGIRYDQLIGFLIAGLLPMGPDEGNPT
jgi:hypothetical protein